LRILDIGTGSGILAEAAELLGAENVFACDIDLDAVEIAKRRVANCFVGSVGAVRPATADIALANISPEAIVALAPALIVCLTSGGVLLASGFETYEVDQVTAALRVYGEILEVTQKGRWALTAVTPRN